MATALPDGVKKLIDGPNFAHLATIMSDGSPQSAPVWVTREGDRVLVGTGEGSLKAKNTRRDPRVALSIVDFGDPYTEAQLRGRVVERRPDPSFTLKDGSGRRSTRSRSRTPRPEPRASPATLTGPPPAPRLRTARPAARGGRRRSSRPRCPGRSRD